MPTSTFNSPVLSAFRRGLILWDQLELTQAIQAQSETRQVTFDVARCLQAMVVNRLMDPSSKLNLLNYI